MEGGGSRLTPTKRSKGGGGGGRSGERSFSHAKGGGADSFDVVLMWGCCFFPPNYKF